MIIGHIGVAFGARRRWPALPFGALLAATFAPDLLREVLERFMQPASAGNVYSHALPWSLLLAAAVGVATRVSGRSREEAYVLAGIVLSHVGLDMLSGTKPIWVGGPMGLNVQAFGPLELLIESLMAVAGLAWLRRGPDRTRWYAARWVAVVLVLIELVFRAGAISQRGYASRCVAHPVLQCNDSSWLTQRWNVRSFWD